MATEWLEERRKRKKRYLWILLLIYAVLYLLLFSTDNLASLNSWDVENSALKVLFVIFVIGYVISWKNELAAGKIFLLWFVGMCYENLFLCTRDCGDGIAMGIPLLILGILLIINSRRKTN
jgi:hypothetical protein